MKKLPTERLIIRQFIDADKESLRLILADPKVMRYSLNGPITIDEARKQLSDKDISAYENENYGLWALIKKDDDELIGFAGLLMQDLEGEQHVEISYRLHPKYWK